MRVVDQAEEHHRQDHEPAEPYSGQSGLPLCLTLPSRCPGRHTRGSSVGGKEDRYLPNKNTVHVALGVSDVPGCQHGEASAVTTTPRPRSERPLARRGPEPWGIPTWRSAWEQGRLSCGRGMEAQGKASLQTLLLTPRTVASVLRLTRWCAAGRGR